MNLKIYPIKTGKVRVKSAQPVRKPGGLIRILSDSEWERWLPIYAWIIDHPEGIIVVDTGDTAKNTDDPNYFPKWHPYYRTSLQIDIKPEEEIGPQLRERGIPAKDIRKVILTHFHTDHAGGLHHFPASDILVSEKDYKLASGITGRLRGYLPHRWPKWFNPNPIHFEDQRYGPFNQSYPITNRGDVLVVPTPGHTPNHISVVVQTEEVHYFLAGDTTYSEELLKKGVPDGVSPSVWKAKETMAKIRSLARVSPLVYLPSHDHKSEERLILKKPVYLDEEKAIFAA
jgi:glyoxylase-like metal-dependent hydrolase (beta-lactamase superfamily II)